MAKKLHSLERNKIQDGKPKFPIIDWSGEDISIPDMSDLVTQECWLLFDMLGLSRSQDWLTILAKLWPNFVEFSKLKEFVVNFSVCNDVAERGIALITKFVDQTQSEEQCQALLQVV